MAGLLGLPSGRPVSLYAGYAKPNNPASNHEIGISLGGFDIQGTYPMTPNVIYPHTCKKVFSADLFSGESLQLFRPPPKPLSRRRIRKEMDDAVRAHTLDLLNKSYLIGGQIIAPQVTLIDWLTITIPDSVLFSGLLLIDDNPHSRLTLPLSYSKICKPDWRPAIPCGVQPLPSGFFVRLFSTPLLWLGCWGHLRMHRYPQRPVTPTLTIQPPIKELAFLLVAPNFVELLQ